jgi:hypothetical protein
MRGQNNPFQKLAQQVRRGEAGAAGALRSELTPHLPYLVRRVLRVRSSSTAVDRSILAEADRLAKDDPDLEPDQLVGRLVDYIRETMIDDLESSRPLSGRDTWAACGNSRFQTAGTFALSV